MKHRILLSALALVVFLPVASPQAGIEADAVVVTINGDDYTFGHIERIRNSLPDAFRQQTMHMNNRAFIETFAYLQTLAKLAEEDKMLEREPFKSQFEFNRTNYLAQTYLSQLNTKIEITDEDTAAYLEEHRSEYEEARVSAIYLDFNPVPELAEKAGKPVVTERDAWEKAEKLLAEMREGADFAELAKEHSDDESSAANGGDLGFFRHDESSVSATVKQAIFSLKPGQTSRPVKDGSRYYIFKVTEKRGLPTHEVRGQVLQTVHSEKLQKRMDDIRASITIEYKNDTFENGAPAPQR